MAINVKNENCVTVVKQLAEQLGVSYTAAIEIAAATALQAHSKTSKEAAASQIEQIIAAYQAHLPVDHYMNVEELYDDSGLFR
ncbi:MAG: type II toxin-antitoxin system VapB family antitoxin [Propionibacteriaceae bacterium]|nr:type II toxin-antitoxin system VapB family antitoxin [Propionibacteriaceae bacterium]